MLAAFVLASVQTVLLHGGTIYDGSGAKPYLGSVRIRGDQILAVGRLKPAAGEPVIELKGLAIAPGFIDAHSHAAGNISKDPLAVSQITQGITTSVVGQDGGWSQPVADEFKELESFKPAINFALFTGHGGIRGQVLGENYKRLATPEEIAKMQLLVKADMEAGAIGLSSGLEYDPGYYSNTTELIALAKMTQPYDGLYISHVRDEADRTFESFDELVQIGKSAGIRTQISHIKLGSAKVWGNAGNVDAILSNSKVSADVYPYLFWQSTISALSPSRDWEDRSIWVKGLADVGGAQNVRLTSYTHEPSWVGKTLTEIAKLTGKDPISIIQEILRKTEGPDGTGRQSVAVTAMQDRDLNHFIKHPKIMFCSDGSIGGSHPRGAGSFPRILAVYVREKKLITLQEAIRKMTSLTAETFRLPKRGRLKPGYVADIVAFDPKTIRDNATASEPKLLSTGMKYVWVSGVKTLAQGKPTLLRNGKSVRRQP